MENRELENLIYEVIEALIEAHKYLGPGFLENVYHRALKIEFEERGIDFESEKEIELQYKEKNMGAHRLDFLKKNELILVLQTVETLHKKHYAQVRSYLKATNKHIGLLANFADYSLDPRRVTSNE